MGTVRSCDARCHKAKAARCVCWCGGLFHGAGGDSARSTFRETFNDLAKTEQDFNQLVAQGGLFSNITAAGAAWIKSLQAAKRAREAES